VPTRYALEQQHGPVSGEHRIASRRPGDLARRLLDSQNSRLRAPAKRVATKSSLELPLATCACSDHILKLPNSGIRLEDLSLERRPERWRRIARMTSSRPCADVGVLESLRFELTATLIEQHHVRDIWPSNKAAAPHYSPLLPPEGSWIAQTFWKGRLNLRSNAAHLFACGLHRFAPS
jgi:hypothetical protein